MAGPNTLTFTDAGWDTDVLQSEQLVLVDFWAAWCRPCVALGPTIDTLAEENAGKVKIGKLDVDSNQATAMRYRVGSIPTLLLFKGGKMVGTPILGGKSKGDLQQLIDQNV